MCRAIAPLPFLLHTSSLRACVLRALGAAAAAGGGFSGTWGAPWFTTTCGSTTAVGGAAPTPSTSSSASQTALGSARSRPPPGGPKPPPPRQKPKGAPSSTRSRPRLRDPKGAGKAEAKNGRRWGRNPLARSEGGFGEFRIGYVSEASAVKPNLIRLSCTKFW